MTTDREPGLYVDPRGRATLRTRSGTFYNLSEIGRRSTIADVDLCIAFARDNHPEDIDELLDARLVIEAEEAAA